MKSWFLKTFVTSSLFALALLGLVASPAVHASPATHAARTVRLGPPPPCGSQVKEEDASIDRSDGDAVFIEAQLYWNNCHELYAGGLGEIDAGCIFGSYCNTYTLTVKLVEVDNGTVWDSNGPNTIPNDGNYHDWTTAWNAVPCNNYEAMTNIRSSDGTLFDEETLSFYNC